MSAAHDGVQGAALDAAVYDALRPGGVKVHELAAASAAGAPGGGCYSARTLKYLEAHQAAHKKGRPPSPPLPPGGGLQAALGRREGTVRGDPTAAAACTKRGAPPRAKGV